MRKRGVIRYRRKSVKELLKNVTVNDLRKFLIEELTKLQKK